MTKTPCSKDGRFTNTRKVLLVCATAALALTCGSARAVSITISDLTDGVPTVTTDPTLKTLVAPEMALVTGTFPLLPGAPSLIPLGSRSVLLTEPATDPFGPRISDIVTLTVSQDPTLTSLLGLRFTVMFMSDGAPGFAALAASLQAANTPTLLEDGTVQDVSGLLNSGPLTVQVQSDLGTNEVPDSGSTLALLGIALVAIALFARRTNGLGRAVLGKLH